MFTLVNLYHFFNFMMLLTASFFSFLFSFHLLALFPSFFGPLPRVLSEHPRTVRVLLLFFAFFVVLFFALSLLAGYFALP